MSGANDPHPWDTLPAALRWRIEAGMLLCLGIGFVAGFVGALLLGLLP